MVPFAEAPETELGGKPVLILSGSVDPILPVENARRLAASLRSAGADVQHEILPAGHPLTQADVNLTATWMRRFGEG
jgi:phospholipase/carboxylesterase